VGRIQNFKNWSPYMVPDLTTSSLGLEYFCNEGDELWNMSDADLVELGSQEIEQIGLAKYKDIIDGVVYRVEKTYPVYESNYRRYLDVIRKYIDGLDNFQTVGRNGLHRYNNQDHAMLTGMLAVRNILFKENHDLWVVNAEQEYHEEIREGQKINLSRVADDVLSRVFLKLDPLSFAMALGITLGFGLLLVTVFFALNEQLTLNSYLWLLVQYLPGYRVSVNQSWLGLVYGFLIGFLVGWVIATLRNSIVKLYLSIIRRRAEIKLLSEQGYFLDQQSRSAGDSKE
jgi:hypothetical protein